ncbi:alkaline phosphatase D family protein [Pseudoblastomonas halimionae]|nr:alkaline phosphatase D family protein [Alteriqipengyuania halimionae]
MIPTEPPATESTAKGSHATAVINRRTLLKSGVLATALAGSPVLAQSGERGFTHGVASGEPGADRVLLWTRFVADSPAKLTYELSDTADFARIVTGGEASATPDRDWCCKAKVNGLEPDSWYYYRFVSPDGSISPVGRTRTLPLGPTERWRMAVFSCSNIGFGWFNAYAHAAAEDAFDMIVHTGDYFYEYGRGTYPSVEQALADRRLDPTNEIVTLADYRARHGLYRRDPDLRRLTQLYPMIAVIDDHESANDSWRGGAENHQPETEGDWSVRKRAAMRAYREWMPVDDEVDYARYDIGDLATLFRLETRLTGRDEQFSIGKVISGKTSPDEMMAALSRFHDGEYLDPSRNMMGEAQSAWLSEGLGQSKRDGTTWQVLVQQVLTGSVSTPTGLADSLGDDVPDYVRQRVRAGALAAKAGLPLNMDAWDGYPAARARLFESALAADADLIVLAGDTHNAWAFDLDHDGDRVGVEFGGQSVTSPGFESYLPQIPADRLASALVEANPQLRWAQSSRRGYMAVELTPTRATSEYRFLSGIRSRSTALAATHRESVRNGERTLET